MSSFVREHTRYPVELAVRMSCGSWGDYLELYTSNLSRGGLFVPSRMSAPIGTEVVVELTLPEGKTLSMRAEVVHVNEGPDLPGRDAGMGLMFIDLDHQTQSDIESMVRLAKAQKLNAVRTAAIANPTGSTASPPATSAARSAPAPSAKPAAPSAKPAAPIATKPTAQPPAPIASKAALQPAAPIVNKPAAPIASKPTPPIAAVKPTPPIATKPTPPIVSKPTPPIAAVKPTPPIVSKPTPPIVSKPTPPIASKPPAPLAAVKPPAPVAAKPVLPLPPPLPPPPSSSGWDEPEAPAPAEEAAAVPIVVEEEEAAIVVEESEIPVVVEEAEVPVVIEEAEAPVAAAPQARAPQFADVVEQALLDELGRRMDLQPHAQLGVSVDAGDEDVEEAFQRLRDRYAPAIFARYGESTALVVQAINDAIVSAHDRLRDPSQRRALSVEAHAPKPADASPEVTEQKRRGEEARTALRAGIERRVEEACAHRDMARIDDAIRGFEAVLSLDRKHDYARDELKKLREKREAAAHKPSGGIFDRLRKR